MSTITAIYENGVFRPTGPVDLPEGSKVVVEAIRERTSEEKPGETLLEFFRRADAELAAAGHMPRTKEEIDADIRAFREEWEDHFRAIERLQDECERARGTAVLIYLDSNIIVYIVEGGPVFGLKARTRLAAIRAAGDLLATSELARMECCARPLARARFALLRQFDSFFALPDVSLLPITPVVFRRATVIRATHGYDAVGAIHLATAIEGGCQAFLTNDSQLSGFPDLAVEVLA